MFVNEGFGFPNAIALGCSEGAFQTARRCFPMRFLIFLFGVWCTAFSRNGTGSAATWPYPADGTAGRPPLSGTARRADGRCSCPDGCRAATSTPDRTVRVRRRVRASPGDPGQSHLDLSCHIEVEKHQNLTTNATREPKSSCYVRQRRAWISKCDCPAGRPPSEPNCVPPELQPHPATAPAG